MALLSHLPRACKTSRSSAAKKMKCFLLSSVRERFSFVLAQCVITFDQISRCYNKLLEEHPDHPYNEYAENILNGLKIVKVGGQYIDFAAPDSTNRLVKASTIIHSNNYTLLDLWAPWCGPCIKKSRAVLAEYNDLKKEGFEVLSVIGGIKNDEQYLEALTKHKYPWLSLKEVQDENQIWQKYNIAGSGGSQFLVNSKGTIVAINPNIEEIIEILNR